MVAICAFPNCSVSRTPKYLGISLFQFPSRKCEFYTTWRKNLLDVLSKYRVMDSQCKKAAMGCSKKMYMCERHFREEDVEYTATGIKVLKLQALPALNFPEKSLETPNVIERRQVRRKLEEQCSVTKQNLYNNYPELGKRVKKCKLESWKIDISEQHIKLQKFTDPYIIPQFDIVIDDGLEFAIVVFGWLLPCHHQIYKKYFRSIRNITVSNLLLEIESCNVCDGLAEKCLVGDVMEHVIPCEIDL